MKPKTPIALVVRSASWVYLQALKPQPRRLQSPLPGNPFGAFSFPTHPAKAGETLTLYGVGFGPTNRAVRSGKIVSAAAPCVNLPQVKDGRYAGNRSLRRNCRGGAVSVERHGSPCRRRRSTPASDGWRRDYAGKHFHHAAVNHRDADWVSQLSPREASRVAITTRTTRDLRPLRQPGRLATGPRRPAVMHWRASG
jgi:hypothetical protein